MINGFSEEVKTLLSNGFKSKNAMAIIAIALNTDRIRFTGVEKSSPLFLKYKIAEYATPVRTHKMTNQPGYSVTIFNWGPPVSF
ncbi:MAG: hypothetical protein B6D64_09280 [Bacteroidetes bacterium 4484_276]|nr:MAG: hypothetical protein B6D64_09280 [Bacteroidetes bacterium 4484_276]